MPRFRKPFRGGLFYAPKNTKMCAVTSGSSGWKAGCVLKVVGNNASTQFYGAGTNEVVVIEADIISASDVAASGVALWDTVTSGQVLSGSGVDYKIIGVAVQDAPTQFLVWGSAHDITQTFSGSTAFENLNIYGYVTDGTIWMPYSGTAPSVGDYVTLSSGTDGYVEKCGAKGSSTDPATSIIIGKVVGLSSGSIGPQHMVDSNIPVCLVDLSFKRGW